MLRIKVEATSANLCVGFDTLGIALDIYNEFTFEKSDEFGFTGFLSEYSNIHNNLVYDSYVHIFEIRGEKPVPVVIGYKGDIPLSRGMGSSSSLIVAGVFAANYFIKDKFTKDELFSICAKIEGHPDNVAPAVYGNLVASFKYEDDYYPNIYKISDKLKFGVVIPNNHVSTESARKVMPKEYKISDIVNNLSRIVNIPMAFESGNLELIKKLFIDTIHEPYRKALINEYDSVKEVVEKYNAVMNISGSGSTMLIISYNYDYENELKDLGYNFKRVNIGSGIEMVEA